MSKVNFLFVEWYNFGKRSLRTKNKHFRLLKTQDIKTKSTRTSIYLRKTYFISIQHT